MFKNVIALVLLSCSVASAQIVVSSSVAEAQAQAALKCVNGCVVLSPAEIIAIQSSIHKAIQKAYQSGLDNWDKVADK
jgi:hypothetical protein